jgi:hypothetical protein
MMHCGRMLASVAIPGFALLGCDSTSPFVVTPTPVASQVRFDSLGQSTALVGWDISVVVRVTDAGGNTIPGATNPVTVGYTRIGPLGMTVAPDGLFGPTTVAAMNGVATFSGLSFHKSGIYTLSAIAPGLSGTTSGSLTMLSGPITRLVFVTQPPNGTAGGALAPFSLLQVDDYGNVISSPPGGSYSATLSLGNNPTGAALGGTLTAQGFGVFTLTFDNVSIDKPGTGYTLVATSSRGWTVTSAPFNIQ